MRGLCLWLLLIPECLASHQRLQWLVSIPSTFRAWEDSCIWIPCLYQIPKSSAVLDRFSLYHNYWFEEGIKDFNGTIIYSNTQIGQFPPQQGRVRFLGDKTNNCTLSIHPVHVNDSGRLGLRMTSEGDKWMKEIQLNVSKTPFPPSIQLPPEIRESTTVALTCLLNFACYQYNIQLQWSLKEPAVTSTVLSTNKVYTESKVTFQPQWTDHGKNVTCQVRNATQVLSKATVRLDVKHVPKLTIEVIPREAAVMEEGSVTMTCQVISSNPEYTTLSWFKDGNLLRGEKTPTLNLSSVTKDMSGKYRCEASNNMGSGKSEEVTVTVWYAPEPSVVQIHQSPTKEEKPVEMICVSPASPRPKNYIWYHNRKIMPGKTQEKFQIPKVFLWHAGNYSCLAENQLGPGQIGQESQLDVQYAPKEVTAVIQSSTPIREGDMVTLSCSYNSSNPAVTHYQWSPEGSWTEPTPGVLRIPRAAWDATPIACAACNAWCTWASPVSLDVQYAPRDVKVLKLSPQTEIHAGHHVQLRCLFSGSRPAGVNFFWKKNGGFLVEGRDLNFDSISPEDAGHYSCMVNNSIGQTSSKAWWLQVLYAPRRLHVSIHPENSVMEGKKAVLTCESEANPPISQYAWFDGNNRDLTFAGQTLHLEPVKVQHSGSYRCQGANQLGVGESQPTTLTVYYSPETLGKRVALGFGFCLVIFILAIWGLKLLKRWKRTQSQQGLQENYSGQSFFVRNKKATRTPLSEGPNSMGCYNPVMDDSVNYAVLRFPETDRPSSRDAGTSETQEPLPNSNDVVTYSVLQKRHMGDYENTTADCSEDDGIHYSELVQFGSGERPQGKEEVEYVTLKQ
uniref:B-cell receptor CD22 n=1 Tax=Jaculus jaculus TaxID=51337 RepID=UPI001E1B52E1|nr:B-cell receptor CD22 [Jaculus jaculus]